MTLVQSQKRVNVARSSMEDKLISWWIGNPRLILRGWSSKTDHPRLILRGWSSEADPPRLIIGGWFTEADHPRLIIRGWWSEADHPRLILRGWSSEADHPRLIHRGWSSEADPLRLILRGDQTHFVSGRQTLEHPRERLRLLYFTFGGWTSVSSVRSEGDWTLGRPFRVSGLRGLDARTSFSSVQSEGDWMLGRPSRVSSPRETGRSRGTSRVSSPRGTGRKVNYKSTFIWPMITI